MEKAEVSPHALMWQNARMLLRLASAEWRRCTHSLSITPAKEGGNFLLIYTLLCHHFFSNQVNNILLIKEKYRESNFLDSCGFCLFFQNASSCFDEQFKMDFFCMKLWPWLWGADSSLETGILFAFLWFYQCMDLNYHYIFPFPIFSYVFFAAMPGRRVRVGPEMSCSISNYWKQLN